MSNGGDSFWTYYIRNFCFKIKKKNINIQSAKIFDTRASYPGGLNVTVMEVLTGLKESNFVCGKTLPWNFLSGKHCILSFQH
jgi:hypothetical protein